MENKHKRPITSGVFSSVDKNWTETEGLAERFNSPEGERDAQRFLASMKQSVPPEFWKSFAVALDLEETVDPEDTELKSRETTRSGIESMKKEATKSRDDDDHQRPSR